MPYVETEGIAEDFDLSTGIGLMLVGNPRTASCGRNGSRISWSPG